MGARLWTRDFVLITLASLCNATGFYLLLPTMPVFVLKALGGDQADVGYVVGLYTAAAVLTRPLSGYLVDTRGRGPVLLSSLAGFAAIAAAYPLAAGLPALFALRVLHGLLWGAVTTAAATVAADVVAAERRGEGIGYFGLSMTIGMAIGPAAGLAILGDGRFGAVFAASAAAIVTALALAACIRYPAPPRPPSRFTAAALLDRDSLPLGVFTLLVMLTYGGIVAFITLYGAELGVANPGLFFVAYAVAITLTRPLAGMAFDRLGPVAVMVPGLLAAAAGFTILGAWRSPAGFLAAAPVLGLGFGMVMPASQAMVINQVAPHRRGAANGTLMTAFDLGIALGAVVLGEVSRRHSTAGAYLAAAAIIALALAYFLAYVVRDYGEKVRLRSAPGPAPEE